jgi:low affinity Fe/Cu permease
MDRFPRQRTALSVIVSIIMIAGQQVHRSLIHPCKRRKTQQPFKEGAQGRSDHEERVLEECMYESHSESDRHPAAKVFAALANKASQRAGRASTFILACAVIIIWAVTGPIFRFSDTWQLVINTGTTIVTFLMVFLIQNSQNRDSAAIQVKLDELIRTGTVQNTFVGIEHLTADELEELRAHCEQRAAAVAAARERGPKGCSP